MSRIGSQTRMIQPSTRFFSLSHLHKLWECEQVAAVCYRARNAAIEFLLVQTRGGRWTFPKGGVEPGLTNAQAAALEAFEEAGVHGRMEEAPFAQYSRRKPDKLPRKGAKPDEKELAVNAYLCEVLRLGPPQESDRNRTWFPTEKAKQHLREDRSSHFGNELARVVDRAMLRIRRFQSGISTSAHTPAARPLKKDALLEVRFEAYPEAALPSYVEEVSFARYIHTRHRPSATIELAAHHQICEIPPQAVHRAAPHIQQLAGTTDAKAAPLQREEFTLGSPRRLTGKLKAWPSDGSRRQKSDAKCAQKQSPTT